MCMAPLAHGRFLGPTQGFKDAEASEVLNKGGLNMWFLETWGGELVFGVLALILN